MPLSDSLTAQLSDSISSLNHRHVISSPSTNSELIDAIQDGTLCANQLHLLTAETQTAGRGQRGRSWQSPPGNVYLSLYHPVQTPISGLLSLIIGVELAKIPIIQYLNSQLQAQGLTPIGVKWANDLGFYKQDNKKGSKKESQSQNDHAQTNEEAIIYFNKLAGILIEPVWRAGKLVGVVMGVGLNVQATPTLTTQTCEGMSYQALSLQDIYELLNLQTSLAASASLPTLQELYEQMSKALIAAITSFTQISAEQGSTQTPYRNEFLRQFATMDALAGLRLLVTQNHQGELQVIHGHACGIDTNGCLQLRQDNGKLAALFTGRIDVMRTV
ncbi:biotin--[acetyl-CoA-carboxylase] ligase [Psychrobacter sp. 16-MNA-CIBAN-0192]|uniref:biotin--[acetyl-CoA-carboxylase] ligase n=1 Tax=Psychrobacter sp. 16-MNA-CIBAN-0192 TaxID=3140448 RepID=UPI0033304BBB